MDMLFEGARGSGKTLGMSCFASIYAKNCGKQLYSNYPLAKSKLIKSKAQMFAIRNGIICIDEAHDVMDSRNFKFNKLITDYFLLLRHYHNDLFLATQALDQIDLRIRRLINEIVFCDKTKSGIHFQFYRRGHNSTFTIGNKITFKPPYDKFSAIYDSWGEVYHLE